MPKQYTVEDQRAARIRALQEELEKNKRERAKLAGQILKSQLRDMIKVEEAIGGVPETLRALRLELQLSQTTVSTALGRKSNILSRIETGKSVPRLDRYLKL